MSFDAQDMYLIGYAAGSDDKADGTYSEPIEAEDGADYAQGYRDGYSA